MSSEIRLLIVGGGPAGLPPPAPTARRAAKGRSAIVTDERRMPYNRPPLTKELLRGEATEAELPLDGEGWLGDRRSTLITGRAVALDSAAQRRALRRARAEYGRCLLATGAEPTRLPVPGADDPAVRAVRTLDDVRELLRRLGDGDPVVVIGSGFIGCEIAASLRLRGHAVEAGLRRGRRRTRPGSARRPASEISGLAAEDGVELPLGREVERIDRPTAASRSSPARAGARRVVVMATGVRPAASWPPRRDRARRRRGPGRRRDAHRRPRAACGRRRVHSPKRGGGARAPGRALGRGARQGEIAGRTAAGTSARGRRPGLLVDDRTTDAQVRRVGRWLR